MVSNGDGSYEEATQMSHDADGDESAALGGIGPVRLIHLRPGVPCVRVHGRLDSITASEVRQFVYEVLTAGPWAVVLELRAVTDLAADAVPPLVELASYAGEADIGLYLVTADPLLDQAFAAAGVSQLFEIHPSIDCALGAMGEPP